MSGFWNTIIGGGGGSTPPPAVPPLLGLNSHMLRPGDRADLKALGMRYVRVPGILQKWERNTDNYVAVMLDMDRAAQEDGLKLLWYLHNVEGGEPQPADSLWHGPQWAERMSMFAEWVAMLPATEAIQPWNEPNGYRQQPFGLADGYRPGEIGNLYGMALALHAERIRRVAPGVKVVAAGLTLLPGWLECLRGIVRQEPQVNAYAIHPYGLWAQAEADLRVARYNAGSTPVWATEFGNNQQNGEPFDRLRHARAWTTFVEGNERLGLAARAYGYVLQTDPAYPNHGLYDLDGTPRAAYLWLQARK